MFISRRPGKYGSAFLKYIMRTIQSSHELELVTLCAFDSALALVKSNVVQLLAIWDVLKNVAKDCRKEKVLERFVQLIIKIRVLF
jgi:hypothetical protein